MTLSSVPTREGVRHRAALTATTSLMIEELEAFIKERIQISPPNEQQQSQGRTQAPNNSSSTSASILAQRTIAKGQRRIVSSAGVPHQLRLQFCHGN
jgi:hypothetical protein